MRLILLSATPMYNSANEIIFILNLLLANDKRKLLKEGDVFNKYGKLKTEGKEILTNACKGYISYVRGENPFTFPLKLTPEFNDDPLYVRNDRLPTFDPQGREVPKNDRIKYESFMCCPMSEYHTTVYKEALKLIQIGDDELEDDDDDDNMNGELQRLSLIHIS